MKQENARIARCLKSSLIFILLFIILSLPNEILSAQEDCPWYQRESETSVPDNIKSHCICATNPSSDNKLSIQCQDVNAESLVSTLRDLDAGTRHALELLYLNGSHVTDENDELPSGLFTGLKIISLQLSSCNIKAVHPEAFSGTEAEIKHLSLSQNELTSVPIEALEKLQKLSLLDLSYNKITNIPPAAFQTLNNLGTLKLNDNSVELDKESLVGLENSLRNLNLKGTRISIIPEAINNLSALAFLDLAQNRLRELEPSQFSSLHSLTALNLERNLLQTLPEFVFSGINDTLSSLSLLNNLITHFPKKALHTLRELRVLDLGFNLLTEIPSDAFKGLNTLTLLALDGNPLATLSEKSFAPLNTTLRGISVGGRFLNCDCKIEWILEWIRIHDLQVTSRERNPQFCGMPASLRTMTFYQMQPDDLQCIANSSSSGDYDVNLSPEDIALLEMGSSPPKSTLNNQPSSSEETSREEQEPEENKTTFTLEVPNFTKNDSLKPFLKPRNRVRPTKFPKLRPTSTTAIVEQVSKHYFESPQSGESNTSSSISNMNAANQDIGSMHLTTIPSTSKASIVQTKNPAIRNPPIKTNNFRPKIGPKIPTVTSRAIASTTLSSLSNTPKVIENIHPRLTLPTTIEPTTTTVVPRTIAIQKQKISKAVGHVNIEEDSNIPVITGIGSAVSSPNLNTGSIMTVKQPIPVNSPTGGIMGPKSLDVTPSPAGHQTFRSVPPNLIFADKSDIVLKDINRNGDSVSLQWESMKQISGFRIIYRFFGEDSFRHGPPLASTESEYSIRNLPPNECLVVCVVPYEEILYNEISPSAASVPPGSQCREIKPNSQSSVMNHMDKITIGASAAICATVLVAVIIFIAITKRSKGKRPTSTLMAKIPPTSFIPPSPGPTMMAPGTYGMSKEWDQMSVISTKSIPRARVYHGSMDGLANVTTVPNRTATLVPHHAHRHSIDGLSTHRSFAGTNHHHHHNHHSNHHNHTYGHHGHTSLHTHGNATAAAAVNNYLNNQSRLLRTSLGSRASYDALNKIASARQSHQQFDNFKRKRAARVSQSESLNTLNGYETPDNWTDHDMDFYVARNPTRHDLVQL